jgi:opacity protein-like surface antigen
LRKIRLDVPVLRQLDADKSPMSCPTDLTTWSGLPVHSAPAFSKAIARISRMNISRCLTLVVLLLASSIAATAQTVPPGNVWSSGTTIDLFAGGASASGNAGPVAGGAAGWELTPWLGVDGNLTWLKTFGNAEAFTTALNARAHFLTNRAVSPYVRAGFGLYRTSFSSASVDVPDFYRRRTADASPGFDSSYRFTDPAWVFGGGVTIFRSHHVAIHPAAETIVVRRDAQSYVVASVTVHVSYHFELHSDTPAGSNRSGS